MKIQATIKGNKIEATVTDSNTVSSYIASAVNFYFPGTSAETITGITLDLCQFDAASYRGLSFRIV